MKGFASIKLLTLKRLLCQCTQVVNLVDGDIFNLVTLQSPAFIYLLRNFVFKEQRAPSYSLVVTKHFIAIGDYEPQALKLCFLHKLQLTPTNTYLRHVIVNDAIVTLYAQHGAGDHEQTVSANIVSEY